MQSPAAIPAINPASTEINPDEYVAPRFAKKTRSKVGQVAIYVKKIRIFKIIFKKKIL